MEESFHKKPVEIILPVFNGIAFVAECIQSLLNYTPEKLYSLTIIDDASNENCQQYLQNVSSKHQQINLIRNNENKGFLLSCNEGMRQAKSKYILLLNSDVILTPNWLQRLLACAESDEKIASVNPLTNSAANIDLPMIPGTNFLSMDWILSCRNNPSYPDVVTGVGFCILLRRSALDKVGLFDEIYGRGYCEESDLCMRLTTQGFRTVIADNVYVFHKGGATFKDRDKRYLKNRTIFDHRWDQEYRRQFKSFQKQGAITNLRQQYRLPQRWDPLTLLRETYRSTRYHLRNHNYIDAGKQLAKNIIALPNAKTSSINPQLLDKFIQPGKLRVTYLLPRLTVAGGVISVVQLVNELILLGVDARIATLYQYPETKNWKLYTSPMVFKDDKDLVDNLPATDVLIATHWSTAQWVADIGGINREYTTVYFLQDYEAWFFPPEDKDSRQKVLATYPLIENKIVKSEWLKDLLKQDGYASTKIWLGLETRTFYKRTSKPNTDPCIIAMARPRTPYRGFETLVSALDKLISIYPKLRIILFGDDLSQINIPFNYHAAGIIDSPDKLAELYSQADIFIDSSDFQGFGRTALEAMACGTACVLTNNGGIGEYAKSMENCILVEPKHSLQIVDAARHLIENVDLRKKIISNAVQTAQAFDLKFEAQKTLEHLTTLRKQQLNHDLSSK